MARCNTAGIYSHYGGTYCSNQDQIKCVNIGEYMVWEYMVFGSIVGFDYYGMPALNNTPNQRYDPVCYYTYQVHVYQQ